MHSPDESRDPTGPRRACLETNDHDDTVYGQEALRMRMDHATRPQLRNVALENACNKGITFKDTHGHAVDAVRQVVYEYHFLLADCCYNIFI